MLNNETKGGSLVELVNWVTVNIRETSHSVQFPATAALGPTRCLTGCGILWDDSDRITSYDGHAGNSATFQHPNGVTCLKASASSIKMAYLV